MNLKGQPPKDQKLSSGQKRTYERWRDEYANRHDKNKFATAFESFKFDLTLMLKNPHYKIDCAEKMVVKLAKKHGKFDVLSKEHDRQKTLIWCSLMHWLAAKAKEET